MSTVAAGIRLTLVRAGFALALSGAMAACGGSVRTNDRGGTGARGSGGKAASTPETGGKTGARTGAGGNAGGAADDGGGAGLACPEIPCAPIDCPTGSVPYVPAGSCCPVCGPTCEGVECPPLDCPVGETALTPAGACCEACTIFPVTTICDQDGYAVFRAKLEEKYGNAACTADWECVALPMTACGIADCGFPLSGISASRFANAIGRYHSEHCIGCTGLTSVCPTPSSSACVGGRCVLVPSAP